MKPPSQGTKWVYRSLGIISVPVSTMIGKYLYPFFCVHKENFYFQQKKHGFMLVSTKRGDSNDNIPMVGAKAQRRLKKLNGHAMPKWELRYNKYTHLWIGRLQMMHLIQQEQQKYPNFLGLTTWIIFLLFIS